MQELTRKFWVEMLVLLITIVALLWFLKHGNKDAVKDHFEALRIEEAKRLFGDAWKESLKYE